MRKNFRSFETTLKFYYQSCFSLIQTSLSLGVPYLTSQPTTIAHPSLVSNSQQPKPRKATMNPKRIILDFISNPSLEKQPRKTFSVCKRIKSSLFPCRQALSVSRVCQREAKHVSDIQTQYSIPPSVKNITLQYPPFSQEETFLMRTKLFSLDQTHVIHM